MDVKVDDVSTVRKKLSFEIDAGKVTEEIDKAYRKIGKNAKLPGFRPGKFRVRSWRSTLPDKWKSRF